MTAITVKSSTAQRHAAVVVQKSTREGFELTVTEAMWKRQPGIASAVGGIQDQVSVRPGERSRTRQRVAGSGMVERWN